MTFKIATQVHTGPDFSFGKIEPDEGLQVTLTDVTRADRFKRQALVAVWAVGDETDLDAYLSAQSEMMDALFLAYPDMAEELTEQIEECRAGLRAGAASQSAKADTEPAEPVNCLGIKF